MTTAAYVRVSTEQQRENESHIKQEEMIKQYCEENDIEDVIFYRDIAESGQQLDRDEHNKMMNNLDNIDQVIVRELSRMGRDHLQILKDVEELDDYDVDFVTLKESIDTSTAMGDAMFKIMSVINELQVELARERQMEEIERRRQKGLNIGRPKKLTEEQIDQVCKWSDKGYSYRAITLLVEDNWDVDISRPTIQRYVKNREDDNGDDN